MRGALRKWNRAASAKLDGKPHAFNYRPEPPTLCRLAQIELTPIKARMMQLEKLLKAVPLVKFGDEHRAQMRARFADLVKSLQTF